MKANHNISIIIICSNFDVSDTSKILKWKQITTTRINAHLHFWCFRYFKDTKMKANHNRWCHYPFLRWDVSDTSKILKWKQITTIFVLRCNLFRCFRYFKDTKMKANHNCRKKTFLSLSDVSDTSKILKWKQITTLACDWSQNWTMFPILQRY